MSKPIGGVFAAAVTPLLDDLSLDLHSLPRLMEFLEGRGCHGLLLFGTTGEGPSFSPGERLTALQVAQDWRGARPDFCLLAGVGTPSLRETIELAQAAFEIGVDGVLALPPYYYRTVSDDGLFTWFSQVIDRAVPPGKSLLAYNIPKVTGVSISLDLLTRLRETFGDRFGGLKDSSGDAEFARKLGERFDDSLIVFTGNDRLFSHALSNHASGCITALANLSSPDLRRAWDAFRRQDAAAQEIAQQRLNLARDVLDRYQPYPPLLKALLSRQFELPRWAVCPPLLALRDDQVNQALEDFKNLYGSNLP